MWSEQNQLHPKLYTDQARQIEVGPPFSYYLIYFLSARPGLSAVIV